MNKATLPTKQSINATLFFSSWLCHQMAEQDVNAVEFAKAIDMDRKSVYDYCSGKRVPKLDTLAKIFNFFDYKKIEIPLTEVEDESVS